MSPSNITKLQKYLPFWEYYQANKCIPPINLPTLEAIAAIYREELHPAPVRLYCSVCVEEMITTLFNQYEREIKLLNQNSETVLNSETHDNQDKISDIKDPEATGKNNTGKNRIKRRKLKRKNKK